MDAHLSEELVQKQLEAYETLALHFHRCGLRVYIRRGFAAHPMRIVDTDAVSPVPYNVLPQGQSAAAQLWAMFK